MSRASFFAILSLLLVSAPAPAQQSTRGRDAYLNIVTSSKGCGQMLPALYQFSQQAVAAGEPWWAISAALDSAVCYVQAGQISNAAKALAFAEKLGLDDCWTIRSSILWSTRSDTTMAAIFARIRQAPADYEEVAWHHAEMKHINHDMSMMITENMNRKDDGWTEVPQSVIPMRVTSSMAIRVRRQITSWMQSNQMAMVMRSDTSRKMHSVNMTIIGNMNTTSGREGPYSYPVQQSRRQAEQRARSRRAAIEARAYRPAGLSTVPRACTSYSSP